MSKPTLPTAVIIHWSLYGLLVVLLAGIVTGAYFVHRQLSMYVVAVDHLKIDSEINERGIINAQKLRLALDTNRESVNRAADIVADTKYYQYQDQIVQDISAYAAASDLTVLGFDFATSPTSKTTTVKNIKTVVATVSLKSPVPYANYLRFLKLIERNLTKMQVTQLDIANDMKTPGAISSPIITLEVYVR